MECEALPDVVEVEYHFKNAMHIFTSFNSAGLVHIDSDSREDAYNKIGPILSRHFSAAYGKPVRYIPTTDYAGFEGVLSGRSSEGTQNLAFTLDEVEHRV